MTTLLDRPESEELSAAAVRDRRHAERARALTDLLQRRPELSGVHPGADVATEAIRWGV